MLNRAYNIVAKKTVIVLLALIVALNMVTTSVFAVDDVKEPDIAAQGAILYCVNTDEVVFEKNADVRFNPYSITKLFTAYIVVNSIDLDTEVTISKKAASQGGSSMFLEEGEVVTIEELLYGMLLMSGNDAAWALAEAVSGDVPTFSKLMNKTAADLGCADTHFVNPNGWKNKEHYTTAADFLILSKAAFENETVMKIAGTKRYEMRATNKQEAWTIKTHVPFLAQPDSGVISGKTGYWEDDDCSISFYYDKKDLRLITILLKDDLKKRNGDCLSLLKYGTEVIPTIKAVKQGEEIKTVKVRHGARTRIPAYAKKTAYAYPKSGKDSDVTTKVKLNKVEAPLRKGDNVGTVEVYADGELTASSPLIVKEDVETGWLPSYLYISNKQTLIIGAILAALIVLRILIRARKKRRIRNRKKRFCK